MFDVQMMRRNVDLEARIIDDLLDLTRIVRGKLSLNPEDADVHELVNAVASMYQPEIHQKSFALPCNWRPGVTLCTPIPPACSRSS